MPDIATGTSYFITEDDRIKEVLEKEFGAEFDGPVGKRKGLLLRKQVKEIIKKKDLLLIFYLSGSLKL